MPDTVNCILSTTHDVTAYMRKARLYFYRTNNVDTAEFTFHRKSLLGYHVPAMNENIEFTRTLPGCSASEIFNGQVSGIKYDGSSLTLSVTSKAFWATVGIPTTSYSAVSYWYIATNITTEIGSPFTLGEWDHACLDGECTTFTVNGETGFELFRRISDITNTDFRYVPQWLEWGTTWRNNYMLFFPATPSGSTKLLEAGMATGNEIIGRPTWTKDDSELYNYVTVVYHGGSTQASNTPSINSYGTRKIILVRKDIGNAGDATVFRDAVLTAYKDPKEICECKLIHGNYTMTGGGSTKEVMPFGWQTHVDDDFNNRDVSGLDCDHITVQWPESYDIATFGSRRSFTKGYLQNIESRLYNVEKVVV